MTDLKESMSRMLEDEPVLPAIADQVVADARQTQRRRRYASGAATIAVIAGGAVAGVAIATSGTQTNHGAVQIVAADSSSPTPSAEQTPMATSSIDTTSGSVQIETPQCPAGQLPNLQVHHDQPVDPTTAVHALSPGAYLVNDYGQPSTPYRAADHFLVDGGPPQADSIWVLAWNAPGPASLSILSSTSGPTAAGGAPFGTDGFSATYVGCLPALK